MLLTGAASICTGNGKLVLFQRIYHVTIPLVKTNWNHAIWSAVKANRSALPGNLLALIVLY